MPSLPIRAIRILILMLSLTATATACGGSANALPSAVPDTGASALAGADASGGADPSALPSGALTDPAEAWPAFAACLRAHGANVADPVLDADGNPQWSDDLKKYITEPIREACSPILAAVDEGGTLKGGRRNRHTYSFDSELAHAECMRSKGFPTWPDPDPNSDGGLMPEGFDKADPTVRAGLIACESLLVETTASPSPGL